MHSIGDVRNDIFQSSYCIENYLVYFGVVKVEIHGFEDQSIFLMDTESIMQSPEICLHMP